MMRKIGNALARFGVGHDGSHGNAQNDIVRPPAVLIGASAVLAVPRAVNARVAVVDQGVDVAVRYREDTASSPTITTVRAAARNEFLTSEADRAVPAVASDHLDTCFVDEFHGIPL